MTIQEAYKVLDLDFGASEDLIDEKFKELIKVHHPDKGGDSSKMSELNIAKAVAMSFIKNKDIYALAIRQVKDIITTERQRQTQKEEYKSEVQIIYKKLDRTKGTYKTIKDISIFIGIITGIFVLFSSNILPIYQQSVGQEASKDITRNILIWGAAFGFLYLMTSNLEAKIKEQIETFKDDLDNKRIVSKLLIEILFFQLNREDEFKRRQNFKLNEFSEASFSEKIDAWLEDSKDLKPWTIFKEKLSSDRDSIRRTARYIGRHDFTQLVLLKSQEKELIQELEVDLHNDDVKYSTTQEFEKIRKKYEKNRNLGLTSDYHKDRDR